MKVALIALLYAVFSTILVRTAHSSTSVAVQLNADALGQRASDAILSVLQKVEPKLVSNATDAQCKLGGFSLCISLGNTPLAHSIAPANLPELGSEAFAVISNQTGSTVILAAVGNPRYNSSSIPVPGPVAGALYASFAALERLGFGFLHPLSPLIPSQFDMEKAEATGTIIEQPKHRVRMWHYHTEHPLELTDVLQGFNASTAIHVKATNDAGESDAGENEYFESWESMLPQLDSFFMWLVANRQNHFEWVILLDSLWEEYGTSTERKGRFSTMVGMAHDWGLLVGADAPLSMI